MAGPACNLSGPAGQAPLSASPIAAPKPSETAAPATATAEPAPAISPTPAPTDTPASQGVVLSSSGGNLNGRRGPGQAYDIVGFLLNGQSSPATGRNEPSTWATIAIPDKPGASGWISVDSGYVSVAPTAGALQSLGILTADPAKPAYLRHCTFHPMAIDPGSFSLKQQADAPDNQMQVNPGKYSALDLSLARLRRALAP